LRTGGAGQRALVLCCSVEFDALTARSLIGAMPQVLLVRRTRTRDQALVSTLEQRPRKWRRHRQTGARVGAVLVTAALVGAAALTAPAVAGSGWPTQATPARDVAREEVNLRIVLAFHEGFFNKHETVESAEVVAEDYIQHNPNLGDGKQALVSFFTGYFQENPGFRSRIVRSAAVGDGGLSPHSQHQRKERSRSGVNGHLPCRGRQARRALGCRSGRPGNLGERQHDVLIPTAVADPNRAKASPAWRPRRD
jgi:predicted SnoaL-like aldol condensation-catalyzing enzyme